MDLNQDARLKELIDLVAKEHNHDKLTKLIAELNSFLDGLKKPVNKLPSK